MKRVWILVVFLGSMQVAFAQHYGGITFTPYAVENLSTTGLLLTCQLVLFGDFSCVDLIS